MESPDDIQAEIDRVLKEAGLDSSPVDPASLNALKELVSVQIDGFNQDENRPPPISSVYAQSRSVLQRRVSDLTQPVDQGTTASIVGSASAIRDPAASATEQRILDKLHQQTQLILELHQRIDTLTNTVDRLSKGGDPIQTNASTRFSDTVQAPPQTQQRAVPQAPRRAVPRAIPDDAHDEDIHPERQAPLPPGRLNIPMFTSLYDTVTGIPNHVRNSRVAKIVKVYGALRRQQAPDFDVLLIFKVLVMMCILMARVSSRRKEADSMLWASRTYLAGVFIVAGFLLKSGYLRFMHNFIVKENYPGRIWNGEEINLDDLPPIIVPRPRAPPQLHGGGGGGDQGNHGGQANAGGPIGYLQRTLLGGRIPQNEPGQGMGVVSAIQDVLCLFGSFFLSIFPMWAPEAPAVPVQHHQPVQHVVPPPLPQEQQEGPQPPGGVNPPRDAFEEEDDDENE